MGGQHHDRPAAPDHWDDYYQRVRSGAVALPATPSRFAVFVRNHVLNGERSILDLGCGHGRDSWFFAANGLRVLAVDESRAALELMRASRRCPLPSPIPIQADLCSPAGRGQVLRALRVAPPPVLCYARFLLHSMPQHGAQELIEDLCAVLPAGTRWAFEFRTLADRHLPKVADHDRRYVDVDDWIRSVRHLGCKVEFRQEGRGMAPHLHEDPVVARVVLRWSA